jgi:hypothetical protein
MNFRSADPDTGRRQGRTLLEIRWTTIAVRIPAIITPHLVVPEVMALLTTDHPRGASRAMVGGLMGIILRMGVLPTVRPTTVIRDRLPTITMGRILGMIDMGPVVPTTARLPARPISTS